MNGCIREIVIIGASGFGKEVAFLIEDINKASATWRIVGFLDDNPAKLGSLCVGYPVLGGTDWLRDRAGIACAVGVGDPRVRRRIVRRIEPMGVVFPSLVHPSVIRHRSVELQDGVIVCAGNILTVEIRLGRHVHLNLMNTVGHGAVLGDFCTVYPGVNLSGEVRLKEGVSMGTGGEIIQGLHVGAGTVVGAGATVVRDLPANVVVVGSPAKPIREISPKWEEEV
jgi:sugar O-acyltransferase (sialic acid O-acetyltransferase NeuD family)